MAESSDTTRCRYDYTVIAGERVPRCMECGALIGNVEEHERFHSILSGHAWALAVLKTAHIAAHTHDRYDVPERIDSKKFDSFTNEALAEVMAQMPDGDCTHLWHETRTAKRAAYCPACNEENRWPT